MLILLWRHRNVVSGQNAVTWTKVERFNSLWPCNGATYRHRSGSTLAQVMACYLTAPSHDLNQFGGLVILIGMQFHTKCSGYLSLIWDCKLLLYVSRPCHPAFVWQFAACLTLRHDPSKYGHIINGVYHTGGHYWNGYPGVVSQIKSLLYVWRDLYPS